VDAGKTKQSICKNRKNYIQPMRCKQEGKTYTPGEIINTAISDCQYVPTCKQNNSHQDNGGLPKNNKNNNHNAN